MRNHYLHELQRINAELKQVLALQPDFNDINPVVDLSNEEQIKKLIKDDAELRTQYALYRAFRLIFKVLSASNISVEHYQKWIISEARDLAVLSQALNYNQEEKDIFTFCDIYSRLAEVQANSSMEALQYHLNVLKTEKPDIAITTAEDMERKFLALMQEYNNNPKLQSRYLQTKLSKVAEQLFEHNYNNFGFLGWYKYCRWDISDLTIENYMKKIEEKVQERMHELGINADEYKLKYPNIYDQILAAQRGFFHAMILDDASNQIDHYYYDLIGYAIRQPSKTEFFKLVKYIVETGKTETVTHNDHSFAEGREQKVKVTKYFEDPSILTQKIALHKAIDELKNIETRYRDNNINYEQYEKEISEFKKNPILDQLLPKDKEKLIDFQPWKSIRDIIDEKQRTNTALIAALTIFLSGCMLTGMIPLTAYICKNYLSEYLSQVQKDLCTNILKHPHLGGILGIGFTASTVIAGIVAAIIMKDEIRSWV